MFSIELAITNDTATPLVKQLGDVFEHPTQHFEQAAEKVVDFLVEYHTAFEQSWKGGHYMAGPHSGQWAQTVPEGWQPPRVTDNDTFGLINTAPYFDFKIHGGTITSTSGRMLTIPLIPEAKGLTAAEYEIESGFQLFIPKGKNVLAQISGEHLTLGGKLKKSGESLPIVPVYALVPSVTQAPWPGAMPPNEEMQDIFRVGILEGLFAQLK